MQRLRRLVLATGMGLAATGAAAQAELLPHQEIGPSGLPLPRFVSIDTGTVYMRVGPGTRYPVLWVYKRRGLPLEVTAEYGQWRRVRDSEGVEGWMHVSMLSGRRMVQILDDDAILRTDPHPDAPPAIIAEAGAQGLLKGCRGDWCRIAMMDRTGWLQRTRFWGSYPGENPE